MSAFASMRRVVQHALHCGDAVLQAGTIAGGIGGAGRTERSRLAIREIAAQHRESGCRECVSECAKKRGLSVAASAMGQDQTVAIGRCGDVQESSDWGIDGRVSEFADG